jgi:hypothetical protein
MENNAGKPFGMRWVRIFTTIVLLGSNMTSVATEAAPHMLTETTARSYVDAWAQKVNRGRQDLTPRAGGGFFGMVGSLGFEFLPAENTLAVRAYIFPRDAEFTGHPELLPMLNKIAAEDPKGASYGTFETLKAPWEAEKEPSLFLRIDLKDGSQSKSAVLSRLTKLREDAMVWRNDKLTKALDAQGKEKRRLKALRSE